MSDLDRFLLLCDPQPEGVASTERWRKAVQGVARIIIESERWSPWEMAEIVARIATEGRLRSDRFGTKVAAVVARALQDSSERNDLFKCVCTMSAAIRVMDSRGLSNELRVSRRDSIAVALWSALSFQKPLDEERLEDVRTEILSKARRAGLDLARRSRTRHTTPQADPLGVQNRTLRWNAVLDREEIEVLRWTLADESDLLGQAYAHIKRDESFALARGLDLGLLLTRFPLHAHYELASRDIAPGHKMDLGELVDAVTEDRNALVAPFEANTVIEDYPAIFPLLTALRVGSPTGADGAVSRSLVDWCGRALLESAIVQRSQQDMEGN